MKNERNQYISIGIDIGADFSLMAAALPSQEIVGRPYKLLHSSQRSIQGAIDRIFSLSKEFGLPARVYMESTGIYHLPVYHKLRACGLEAFVLNPLITHANRNANIRKIHNDKLDAQRIALLGLRPDLKTSLIPDDETAAIKAMLREYHAMKKEISMYICRLKNQLRQSFPQYLPVFSKVNGKASLALLSRYPSPEELLEAGPEVLSALICQASGRGLEMAQKKADALLTAAQEALCFGHGNKGISYLIRHYVEMLRLLTARAEAVLKQVRQSVAKSRDSLLARQVKLLESIPGAGFLTAVTLVCEIGDFSAFRRAKQLFSYFGLDPAVDQSGKKASPDLQISKRGSPYARRCFYTLALQSVSLCTNGKPKNPVIRSFYQDKCKTKEKMVALGAVMHKLCNIVFAVLRDGRPFELITPQEHCQRYLSTWEKAA